VLSGFVISSGYALKIRTQAELLEFFRHRFRRLSFQYYLSGAVWLVAALIALKGPHVGPSIETVIRYALFIDVFFDSDVVRLNPVAWSVMAEFWIYALFAVATFLLPSLTARLAFAALVVVCGVATLASGWPDLNLLHGLGAILRALTGFFLGAFCWVTLFGLRLRWLCHVAIAALAVGIIGVVLLAGCSPDLLTLPFSAMTLVLFSGIPPPSSDQWAARWRWLGDISYPLYLWHFILSVVTAKLISRMSGGATVMFAGEKFVAVPAVVGVWYCLGLVLVSVLVAALMMRWERMMWSWLKRKKAT
jgi:peptidoglycan/LPS O-acetylase OafA/YrhL